jgi:hypothetical protein
MKKRLVKILLTPMLPIIFFGCKKNNSLPDTTPPATNYVEIIKDKSWWGEFTYTGKDPEYYSVHFNIDSTLVWSQFSGDYNGKWAVKDNELTMHVDRGNAEIKAIINNDKLSNITDNTGNSTIDIAHLIVRSNLPLDNTVWDATPILSNGIYGYLISFMSDLKVDIQETYFEPPSLYKSYLYPDNKYKRSTEGAVVRSSFSSGGAGSTSVFFAIIISDSAMIGSSRNPNNQWTAVRYE